MTAQDKKQFAVIMATMSEIFDQGKEVSAFKMDLYFKALSDFAIDQVSLAASKLIHGRVFPSLPKPAEIIQEIIGKQENRATEVWLKALNAVKRIGNYQSVRFSDVVIHSVIESMGGWEQFCMMEINNEKWKQKEFERLYVVISAQPSARHHDYLPGSTEMANYALGFSGIKSDIVAIGDDGEMKLIENNENKEKV